MNLNHFFFFFNFGCNTKLSYYIKIKIKNHCICIFIKFRISGTIKKLLFAFEKKLFLMHHSHFFFFFFLPSQQFRAFIANTKFLFRRTCRRNALKRNDPFVRFLVRGYNNEERERGEQRWEKIEPSWEYSRRSTG